MIVTFADFLYAIVLSSAISGMVSPSLSYVFFGQLFLIIVLFEDYLLYQNEVKPYLSYDKLNPRALMFEAGILLFWNFSYMSIETNKEQFLYHFVGFMSLKWFASSSRFFSNKVTPAQYIDQIFLITIFICLLFLNIKSFRNYMPSNSGWVPISFFWLLQTSLWWNVSGYLKNKYKKRGEPLDYET